MHKYVRYDNLYFELDFSYPIHKDLHKKEKINV